MAIEREDLSDENFTNYLMIEYLSSKGDIKMKDGSVFKMEAFYDYFKDEYKNRVPKIGTLEIFEYSINIEEIDYFIS